MNVCLCEIQTHVRRAWAPTSYKFRFSFISA